MFEVLERFTEGARVVMAMANHAAMRLGEVEALSAEHILLGLVYWPDSVCFKVLRNLHVPLSEVIQGLESQLQAVSDGAKEGAPEATWAKPIIGSAIEAADELGHKHIGTGHLFLGLLRATDSAAVSLLTRSGRTVEEIRIEALRLISDDEEAIP